MSQCKGAAALKPKELVFMATDAHGRLGAEHRRTIRSHVMRGKNTRRGVPRKRRRIQSDTMKQDPTGESAASESYNDLPKEHALVHGVPSSPGWTQRMSVSVPRTPHDLSLVKFCEDLDITSMGKIVYFCAKVKRIIYPVDRCSSVDVANTVFFQWMLDDPAYLHTTLYTVSVFFDVIAGRTSTRATDYHLYRAVGALKSRVSNVDEALTDATAASVMSLTIVAECFGDLPSAALHFRGLRRIVEMRGGVDVFRHNGELYSKLCRVDFGHAMTTGSKPAFSGTMLSFTPFFRRSPELAAAQADSAPGFGSILAAVRLLDPRLGVVLKDLHDFSQLANTMFETGETMHPVHLHGLLTSAQYRLLELDFGADQVQSHRFAELVRLSLLAYLSTLFLRVPGVRLSFHFLGRQLKAALMGLEPATREESRLYGWALVVGAMSVLSDPREEWLRERMSRVIVPWFGTEWEHVQRGLRQVAWIDATHGEPGAEVFAGNILSRRVLDFGDE